MAGKTFHQLASSLSKEERITLLQKIENSLSIETSKTKEIFHVEVTKDQRSSFIQRDIQKAGFFLRLLLWFKKLFTNKSENEVFYGIKLNMLKREVQHTGGEVCDFDERMLLPEFARIIFLFYANVILIRPLFKKIWQDGNFFVQMVSYLLEKKIPNAKKNSNDFIPKQEMEDIFYETESKNEIIRELEKRINDYLDHIQGDLFDHLREGVLPLYYMKDIILFPYVDFFKEFGIDIGSLKKNEEPKFKKAKIAAVIDILEKFFYAVYAVKRIKKQVYLHDELIQYFINNNNENQLPQRAETETIRLQLSELIKHVQEIEEKIPFVNIIRFFRNDPYYRFTVYVPKLKLKEFYASSLRLHVMENVDRDFISVREGTINRMIKQIFGDSNFDMFEFYKGAAISLVLKLRLPTFKYVRSAAVLYSFLKKHYLGRIQELVHVLNRIVPARMRDAQSRMLLHAAGLEDTQDKLKQFDYSFSPESEEGKKLFRMRYSLENDITQQKAYRILVAQKDKEVRVLIDAGLESIEGFITVFKQLQAVAAEGMQDRWSAFELENIESKNLNEVLEGEVASLGTVKKLINQLIVNEEGL